MIKTKIQDARHNQPNKAQNCAVLMAYLQVSRKLLRVPFANISPAPDTNQELPPTKPSNNPPASPSEILNEDSVNTSMGNGPQPNKDRIGQSAQVAHQGESRRVKRKFGAISSSTPQSTEPSNGGGVSSSS